MDITRRGVFPRDGVVSTVVPGPPAGDARRRRPPGAAAGETSGVTLWCLPEVDCMEVSGVAWTATLFALTAGAVQFGRFRDRKVINIVAVDA